MFKKIVICLLSGTSFLNANAIEEDVASASSVDEFQELSEPYRYIGGAYYGLGIGISRMPSKVVAKKSSDEAEKKLRTSQKQPELSLITGFGTSFYKDYYAGIELELFRRFSSHKKFENGIGLLHCPTYGLNMDVRFGYQLPLYSTLVYATAGIAKIVGKISFEEKAGAEKGPTSSFSSYSPTIGIGIERRINYSWNIRLDSRFSLSKKKKKEEKIDDNTTWKYEGRANRISVRLSVVKNI